MAYGAVQSRSRQDRCGGVCAGRLRVWQCHRARNEVERGRGGGLAVWGRRALERRGRETSGSLEQRKRPTMREDRRHPRPEPGRLTCPNSGTPLKAKPGTVPPAQGVPTGEPTLLDDGEYALRQQAERLPPGCPEHFRRGSPRWRRGGIAARYKQAEGLPRSGGTGLF